MKRLASVVHNNQPTVFRCSKKLISIPTCFQIFTLVILCFAVIVQNEQDCFASFFSFLSFYLCIAIIVFCAVALSFQLLFHRFFLLCRMKSYYYQRTYRIRWLVMIHIWQSDQKIISLLRDLAITTTKSEVGNFIFKPISRFSL